MKANAMILDPRNIRTRQLCECKTSQPARHYISWETSESQPKAAPEAMNLAPKRTNLLTSIDVLIPAVLCLKALEELCARVQQESLVSARRTLLIVFMTMHMTCYSKYRAHSLVVSLSNIPFMMRRTPDFLVVY